MTVIETTYTTSDDLTTRQRWGNYFAIALGFVAVLVLLNLRTSITNATTTYTNSEEGIIANYPEGWLIDENGGEDYIFRVRDMREIGFKTTFRVSTIPTSNNTTQRTILDALAMERAQTLSNYRVLSIEPYTGFGDLTASFASYQYVDTDQNPFQESLPSVVRGVDVLVLSRGQAVVITLLSDVSAFDENFARFERFLANLDF